MFDSDYPGSFCVLTCFSFLFSCFLLAWGSFVILFLSLFCSRFLLTPPPHSPPSRNHSHPSTPSPSNYHNHNQPPCFFFLFFVCSPFCVFVLSAHLKTHVLFCFCFCFDIVPPLLAFIQWTASWSTANYPSSPNTHLCIRASFLLILSSLSLLKSWFLFFLSFISLFTQTSVPCLRVCFWTSYQLLGNLGAASN